MLNDTMADRERDDNNGGGYIKELKLVSTQSTVQQLRWPKDIGSLTYSAVADSQG